MGLSPQQIALGRQSYAPFPTVDPDPVTGVNRTKRDFDFTKAGAGYASAAAIATAMTAAFGETWTVGGSGASCDAKGFIPGSSGCIYAPINAFNPFGTSGTLQSWTLYLQVERAVCSTDGTYNNSGALFNDSVGALNATTTERVVFASAGPGAASTHNAKVDNVWNAQPLSINVQINGGTVEGSDIGFPTSRIPAQLDPVYNEIILSMVGTKLYTYVDGQLIVGGAECGASPPGTWMNQFYIGAANNAGLAAMGNYHIKRFQISSRGCAPVTGGPLVAFFGDSFFAFGDRGENSNQPAGGAGSTKAQIDAVQKGLFITQYPVPATNYPQIYDNARWIRVLQALSNKFNGFIFPYYWAGCIGHGWGKNATAATGWTQPFQDAVNGAQPEILVCSASVNDINSGASQQLNLLADAQSYLNYFVDNNPRLRRILFFGGFNWMYLASPIGTGGYTSPSGYNAEWLRILGVLQGLQNYAAGSGARATNYPGRGLPNTVPVSWIPTDAAWKSDPNYVNFFNATNPLNFTSSSQVNGGGSVDFHPCSSGNAKIAELMFPQLQAALLAAPN